MLYLHGIGHFYPENLTRSINYSDRGSAVLFGDGSSAAVVSATVPSRASFVSCYCDSKPSAWEKVSIPRMGYFQQDGNAVQRFTIHKTTESLSMLNTVCERTGIAVKDHWYNVTDYGDTGCSGAPAVLSQHWDELKPGYHVAISLVGAGLTWTHTLFKVEGEE
jgi:3-oxoacyl-[acyl-carrier-protein] synthase-3